MPVISNTPRVWPASPAKHQERYKGQGLWRDKTIYDWALERVQAHPDANVFPGLPQAATYASLLADAEALSASLWDMGIRPGDVVSFQTPNWVEACVINLAAASAGFVINPIVTIYRDAEVKMMLADSRSKAIFITETYRKFDYLEMMRRLTPSLPDLRHTILVRGALVEGTLGYEELIRAAKGRKAPAPRIDPHSIKLLLYTSGTTGRPKGVLHSHNSLARAELAGVAHWGVKEGDAILMPSPVTHVSGYSNGLELPFVAGTRTVLMEAWNAEAAVELIDKYSVASTVAATPFLQELAAAAHRAGSSLPSLVSFACGGAAVPPDIVRNANRDLGRLVAFRVFGSSEAPLVTLGYRDAGQEELAATTDGAIIDYEVRVVDDQDNDVAHGANGEILARGPAMLVGYADPAQTHEAVTHDGYFRTGDIGRITPEGGILITGRKKDLIIRGGENISAKEIEDVLHQHPAVQEAAIVSMPHDRLGEGVMAFIILRPEMSASVSDLLDFVGASGLAKQKIPERFAFKQDFPRTASGKIRKDILREDAKSIVAGA